MSDFNLGELTGAVGQIDKRLDRLEGKMDEFIDAAHKARTLWEKQQSERETASALKTNIFAGGISAAIAAVFTYFLPR